MDAAIAANGGEAEDAGLRTWHSQLAVQSNAYITAYMTIEDHVFVAPCVQTTNDNFMGRTEKRHALIKGATVRRGADPQLRRGFYRS